MELAEDLIPYFILTEPPQVQYNYTCISNTRTIIARLFACSRVFSRILAGTRVFAFLSGAFRARFSTHSRALLQAFYAFTHVRTLLHASSRPLARVNTRFHGLSRALFYSGWHTASDMVHQHLKHSSYYKVVSRFGQRRKQEAF